MIEIIKNKIKPKEPYYTVKMRGDYNDADYSYSEAKYKEYEFEIIKDYLYEIIKLVGIDYCNGYFNGNTKYEFVSEHIDELIANCSIEIEYPYGDTCGDYPIHSLENVNITYTDCDGYVFEVMLVSK